jgi:hypothetical protein
LVEKRKLVVQPAAHVCPIHMPSIRRSLVRRLELSLRLARRLGRELDKFQSSQSRPNRER